MLKTMEVRLVLMIECNDPALREAVSDRQELFSALRRNDYVFFHLSSFESPHPFGLCCDETFPSAGFNFAAIPAGNEAIQRWKESIAGISEEVAQ